jgi:proline utilization trans-activator
MYTQYLFSASLILAISSLLKFPGSQGDSDDFETATQILEQLEQAGSFAAKEFCMHIAATKSILEKVNLREEQSGRKRQHDTTLAAQHGTTTKHAEEVTGWDNTSMDASGLTWAESSLQELLSQSDLNIQSLEPSIIHDGLEPFVWPEGEYSSWRTGWGE